MEKRTRYQNTILIILAVMTVCFGALLIYNRSQPGIIFREAFLKQEMVNEITVYSGKCKGKEIYITVTPMTEGTAVNFLSTDGWEREYFVSGWDSGLGKSPAEPVRVTDEQGTELFQGFLWQDDYLMDEHGDIDLDKSGFSVSIGYAGMDEWQDYEPSILRVIKLAMEPEVICRGSVGLFLLMLLAALCVAVDILFPAFWFQLEHMFSVRDPEPSDFYIAMQKLGWAVFPVLIAVGYWIAATWLE